MNTVKAQDALSNVGARHWIVGTLCEQGNFSISPSPSVHITAQSAELECERLAKLKPGTAYISMQFRAGRLVPKVTSIQSF